MVLQPVHTHKSKLNRTYTKKKACQIHLESQHAQPIKQAKMCVLGLLAISKFAAGISRNRLILQAANQIVRSNRFPAELAAPASTIPPVPQRRGVCRPWQGVEEEELPRPRPCLNNRLLLPRRGVACSTQRAPPVSMDQNLLWPRSLAYRSLVETCCPSEQVHCRQRTGGDLELLRAAEEEQP